MSMKEKRKKERTGVKALIRQIISLSGSAMSSRQLSISIEAASIA